MRFDKESSPATINEGRGWTIEHARTWLHDHKLHADLLCEESAFLRFRQSDDKSENPTPVSIGMPDGVLIMKCDAPSDPKGFRLVDGKSIYGKALSSVIEIALPIDAMSRQSTLRKLAKKADVSLATMHMLVGGKLNCPTKQMLQLLADTLEVPMSRLLSAAKQDGCEYEQ